MTEQVSAVVIGGGIAGVSAAYHLAALGKVALLEAEANLAHHSTGRSAALFFENYGAEPIRPLTRASKAFFLDPDPELVDTPLVAPRGALWIGRPEQAAALARVAEEGRAIGSGIVELAPSEAVEKAPMVDGERLGGAVWEPDPLDIDVAAAHQAYVRGLRSRGGTILTSSPVASIDQSGRGWRVAAGNRVISTDLVVDAAGAWGDQVASLAGVDPVGLTPMRRTAFMVEGRPEWAHGPMVVDVDHTFYFKPDGSQVLCSPGDETPTVPGDARPDPVDVSGAIERINAATTLAIRSVRTEWAGLRTFTGDRAMVIGPEPTRRGFVWLVGQGGTGIQTAPAAAELVTALAHGFPLPHRLLDAGVDPERLGPQRLR
ncbi:FAD-dependent oxidoreductase [soil metagenome]